jgi:antitoxin (DNA-binding transcriptional repressor) of toxin-antitoxin stability system
METKIDIKQLADGLFDVLNRVHESGERFVIECEGKPVAALTPVVAKPGISGRDLADALRDVPRPDDQFADDLEAIHNAQPQLGRVTWPS